MTAPMCMWAHCDRPARINVAVHRRTSKSFAHGTFCVPHSVLTSRAQTQAGVEVWFDWVRAGRDRESDPVDVSLLSPDSALDGVPRLRGLDESGGIDPLEPAH
jgi:hypothetical protein